MYRVNFDNLDCTRHWDFSKKGWRRFLVQVGMTPSISVRELPTWPARICPQDGAIAPGMEAGAGNGSNRQE